MLYTQYEIYHEKKKHTSSDFPYNTYLCSIPLDFSSVPIHWHSEMEIIVIKKGHGLVYVDLTPIDVSYGDIIFVLPGQLHSIHQKNNDEMEYENIIFKTELLMSQSMDLCNTAFFQPVFDGTAPFPTSITKLDSCYHEIINCINLIDSLCDQKSFGYQISLKGHLYQMFYLIISSAQNKHPLSHNKKNLEKLKLILSYIQEHYASPITIDEIADACHYSSSHFMKFFKENMGISFVQYLNDYRLNLAADMLRGNTDSVLEIALRTGFDNLSYFTRMFKKKYGLTPGKYRTLG